MKDYDKNKESSYLQYWDVSNLYGWTMPQKFPINNFEWIEDTSQFNEDFITIMKKVMKDIFWKLMVSILKNYMNFIIANLPKTENYIHVINLKQAWNHGLAFQKVHRVIKFNQNA